MATSAARTRFPTRILLSAAAFGAVGGLFVIALNWLSVAGGALAFYFYAATIAFWALPVLVSQAVLRRPGVALLTATLMGLVNAPFVVGGAQQILNFVVAGILVELPFVITLYRRWSSRMFWIAHTVSGLLFSLIYLLLVILGLDAVAPWIVAVTLVGLVVSSIGAAALGQLLASRLRKAGVGGSAPVRVGAPADSLRAS